MIQSKQKVLKLTPEAWAASHRQEVGQSLRTRAACWTRGREESAHPASLCFLKKGDWRRHGHPPGAPSAGPAKPCVKNAAATPLSSRLHRSSTSPGPGISGAGPASQPREPPPSAPPKAEHLPALIRCYFQIGNKQSFAQVIRIVKILESKSETEKAGTLHGHC